MLPMKAHAGGGTSVGSEAEAHARVYDKLLCLWNFMLRRALLAA